MTTFRIIAPDLQIKHEIAKSTINISMLAYYGKIELEIPCQIFEELIKNISTFAKRPEVKPEEISTESIKEIADKAGYASYNNDVIAHTIAAVLNTDIKLIKNKKYKVKLKLQKQVDKEMEQEVLAVSHEDAFIKAHEKAKHDWPSYKVVDTKSEEVT